MTLADGMETRGRPRKGHSPWPPDRIEAMREVWLTGMKAKDIAVLFQTTTKAVLGVAHRHGFPRHSSSPRLTPEERKERKLADRKASYERRKARIAADPEYRAHRQAMIKAYRVKDAVRRCERARRAYVARERVKSEKPKRTSTPKNKGGPPLVPYIPRIEAVPDTAVTFMQLDALHCRWVIGEPKGIDTIFCGGLKAGESYCAEHCRRAFKYEYRRVPTAYPMTG